MKIGFIGLGAMGYPMTKRLIQAGHSLFIYNRTVSKATGLLEMGATFAETPEIVARESNIVFSMMFNDKTTHETTFGKNGIASGLSPDSIHVCCSTVSLEQARLLRDGHAERGQVYVSANVLGRPPAAEAGELFIMAAGESSALNLLEPVLKCFGPRVFKIGSDPIQANLAKLSLNFMIYSTIEQMAEVFALNEKAGTDPCKIFELMTGSFCNAPVHKNYGRLMVEQQYNYPGAPVTLGLKDIEMFLGAGGDYNVPLPYASIVRDHLLSAISAGNAEKDFVILMEHARKASGLPDVQ
ncbi:NAD(P)-dependent oxidoreductase [Neokomagataea anthophila]|uniref:NAD(P)-dependent oxidoreductase n=1 Tax=Neokomagataea anthophila TaxID=2826925 RepID=A0ABS5E4R4_9PROT|nr:NAD(P)-dependent oxidoreductase [Neokomagataea anthophila]MBR0558900.1 NAD(P)-dependent oxidoreductase [Neokomagataea anthophila]